MNGLVCGEKECLCRSPATVILSMRADYRQLRSLQLGVASLAFLLTHTVAGCRRTKCQRGSKSLLKAHEKVRVCRLSLFGNPTKVAFSPTSIHFWHVGQAGLGWESSQEEDEAWFCLPCTSLFDQHLLQQD